MGGSSSSTTGTSARDTTTVNTLDAPGAGETEIRSLLNGLSDDQISLLSQQLDQWGGTNSPLALTPAAQQDLDLSQQAAITRFNDQARMDADYLSGVSGLRMSDTPVAQRVLNQYGMGLGGIVSNRATTGLDLGLSSNMSNARQALGLTGAIPGLSSSLGQSYLRERQAAGTSRTTGWETNSQSSRFKNPNQDINTGIGIAGAVGTAATVAVAI